MIKKIVLAIAVAAFAVSFAPTVSHAKKGKKAGKCTTGQMMAAKPNSMGWSQVMGCGADGKMYPTLMMCYMPSSFCPPSQ